MQEAFQIEIHQNISTGLAPSLKSNLWEIGCSAGVYTRVWVNK